MLVKDKILYERKKKGISASKLGEMIGSCQATISKYETGSIKVIPSNVLKEIVKCLECDFDEFVSDDPKYCMLASKSIESNALSEEDKSLIAWFHNLPEELQGIIRQLWNIQLS
jgi:transcriptional regulator with XRE-family HTH domain